MDRTTVFGTVDGGSIPSGGTNHMTEYDNFKCDHLCPRENAQAVLSLVDKGKLLLKEGAQVCD